MTYLLLNEFRDPINFQGVFAMKKLFVLLAAIVATSGALTALDENNANYNTGELTQASGSVGATGSASVTGAAAGLGTAGIVAGVAVAAGVAAAVAQSNTANAPTHAHAH